MQAREAFQILSEEQAQAVELQAFSNLAAHATINYQRGEDQ